jgi:putative ABC transport system permease protein
VTLTLGGAVFIATFQVRDSVEQYILRLGKYFLADINLALDRPYRVEEINQVIRQVPGVVDVEAWGFSRCELVLTDGTASDSVQLMAPPAGSPYVDPILLQGRWLDPADENAITVNERFLSQFPALKTGDPLRLKVNGQETDWVIVGVFQFAGDSTGFIAYVNYEYLARLTNQPGRTNNYRVVTGAGLHTLEAQTAVAQAIDNHLQALGYEVMEARPGQSLTQNAGDGLNILTIFLMVMASLTALVGGIGLTGTMGLNVMERTREIGILRAIGAPDRAIMTMVIVEGWIIGGISWALGSLLAFPISQAMADVVSQALFNAPATFNYTPTGFVVWLAAAMVLSTLASLLPARSAARLTIREVLAYE